VLQKIFESIDSLYETYLDVWEDVCNIESPTSCKAGVDAVGRYFIRMAGERGLARADALRERYEAELNSARQEIADGEAELAREQVSSEKRRRAYEHEKPRRAEHEGEDMLMGLMRQQMFHSSPRPQSR